MGWWSIPDLQSRSVHAGAGYNVVQSGVVRRDNKVQWGQVVGWWSIPDVQSRSVHAVAGYNVVQCGVVQWGVVQCSVVRRDNMVHWGNGGDMHGGLVSGPQAQLAHT